MKSIIYKVLFNIDLCNLSILKYYITEEIQ